jgi:hypothetical protein
LARRALSLISACIVVRYAPVPSSTIEQYEEVQRRLQDSGEMPAEVWDSQEQLEAFGARIMPLLEALGVSPGGAGRSR